MNYTELNDKVIELSHLSHKEILEFVETQGNDEFLVDLKMIVDICEKDKDYSIKDFLELQRKFKRIAILDILSTTVKDRKLFEEIRDTITGNQLSKLEHIKNVVKNLRDYVGVSDCAVKEFGEVMTPIELVEEMLDTLPPEVWSNPNLKWLDPANGVGIFPCVVVYRLMEGLKEFEPNEDLRYKHIMENMLYVCELQTKNMFIYQTGFDPYDEIELNIHNGSFLDKGFEEKMKIWGVEKFDIVVGNPPYQGIGRKKLHIEFTHIILNDILVNNGIIVFVTPKIIIQYLMGHEISQKKLNYFYVINKLLLKGIEKYFNVDSDFCVFNVSKKIKQDEYTIIDGVEINLEYKMFLPYDMDINIINIFKKCLNGKNEMNRRAARIEKNLNEYKSDVYKNTIVYKIKTKHIEYKYTNITHKDMFKPKILLPTVGDKIIIDYNNNLFPGTSFVVYCVTENNMESENLVNFINSKLFKYICSFFKTMRSPLDYVLKNIKKPTLNNNINYYDFFDLSEDEISLIEKY